MKIFNILGIIVLFHLSLFSQNFLSRTQISDDTILFGNKMIVKISFNKMGKFIPPDLSGFEVIAGPINKVIPSQKNKYNTLENYYVFILKPLKLGMFYFDNSFLVSGKDTLKSGNFYFWVIPNPEGKVIKPKLDKIPDFGNPVSDNLFSIEKVFLNNKSDIDTYNVEENLQKAFEKNNKKIIEFDTYDNGIIIPVNKQKAIDTYKKSALKGNVDAQYSLGFLYSHGKEAIDKSKALYWYEKAANQNHSKAQFQAGVMYEIGDGIPEDKTKALKWFEKCAELGDVKCQFNTGYFYLKAIGTKKNLKKAFYWFKKSADQGDKIGQFNVGIMYANGFGVDKNISKAIKWYLKSANQGYDKAQFNLGALYLLGENGVKQDMKKAYFWLNKAKEGGNSSANRVLDELSEKKSQIDDLSSLKKMDKKHIAKKQFHIAYKYFTGNGVEKDINKAIELFTKAAEKNHLQAQVNLGFIYSNNKYGKKDLKKSFYWYQKAALQNDVQSQAYLANLYYFGKGTKKDIKKAFYWYQKAANANDNNAQYNLGVIYLNGEVGKKNEKKALYWLKKAKENGNPNAQEVIKRIENQ